MTVNMNFKSGFTIIEILISVAIMAIIFSLGLIFGVDFFRNYIISSERDMLVSILSKARSQAANNISQSAHGVYITSSDYIIFQGNSYSGRDQNYDQKIPASSAISKSGPSEIVFSQLSAESNASGTIILSNSQKTLAISVNNEGKIDW